MIFDFFFTMKILRLNQISLFRVIYKEIENEGSYHNSGRERKEKKEDKNLGTTQEIKLAKCADMGGVKAKHAQVSGLGNFGECHIYKLIKIE